MKKLLISITFTMILYVSSFSQQGEPIIISPLIGNKLDRIEEEYFRLLPALDNVQEAIFYLNPDSTLDVRVSYESDNLIVDSLIENYLPYKQLQDFIEYQIEDETNKARNIERGKYANIFAESDSIIAGELLSLNKSSTILLNLDKEAYYQKNIPPFDVRYINNTKVSKVIVFEETNIAPYIYPVLGAIIGGIIGAAVEKDEPPRPAYPTGKFLSFNFDIDLHGEIILGALLGALVGTVLSFALPIEIGSETVYLAPFDENDIEGLSSISRYKEDIPYFMQKVIQPNN